MSSTPTGGPSGTGSNDKKQHRAPLVVDGSGQNKKRAADAAQGTGTNRSSPDVVIEGARAPQSTPTERTGEILGYPPDFTRPMSAFSESTKDRLTSSNLQEMSNMASHQMLRNVYGAPANEQGYPGGSRIHEHGYQRGKPMPTQDARRMLEYGSGPAGATSYGGAPAGGITFSGTGGDNPYASSGSYPLPPGGNNPPGHAEWMAAVHGTHFYGQIPRPGTTGYDQPFPYTVAYGLEHAYTGHDTSAQYGYPPRELSAPQDSTPTHRPTTPRDASTRGYDSTQRGGRGTRTPTQQDESGYLGFGYGPPRSAGSGNDFVSGDAPISVKKRRGRGNMATSGAAPVVPPGAFRIDEDLKSAWKDHLGKKQSKGKAADHSASGAK